MKYTAQVPFVRKTPKGSLWPRALKYELTELESGLLVEEAQIAHDLRKSEFTVVITQEKMGLLLSNATESQTVVPEIDQMENEKDEKLYEEMTEEQVQSAINEELARLWKLFGEPGPRKFYDSVLNAMQLDKLSKAKKRRLMAICRQHAQRLRRNGIAPTRRNIGNLVPRTCLDGKQYEIRGRDGKKVVSLLAATTTDTNWVSALLFDKPLNQICAEDAEAFAEQLRLERVLRPDVEFDSAAIFMKSETFAKLAENRDNGPGGDSRAMGPIERVNLQLEMVRDRIIGKTEELLTVDRQWEILKNELPLELEALNACARQELGGLSPYMLETGRPTPPRFGLTPDSEDNVEEFCRRKLANEKRLNSRKFKIAMDKIRLKAQYEGWDSTDLAPGVTCQYIGKGGAKAGWKTATLISRAGSRCYILPIGKKGCLKRHVTFLRLPRNFSMEVLPARKEMSVLDQWLKEKLPGVERPEIEIEEHYEQIMKSGRDDPNELGVDDEDESESEEESSEEESSEVGAGVLQTMLAKLGMVGTEKAQIYDPARPTVNQSLATAFWGRWQKRLSEGKVGKNVDVTEDVKKITDSRMCQLVKNGTITRAVPKREKGALMEIYKVSAEGVEPQSAMRAKRGAPSFGKLAKSTLFLAVSFAAGQTATAEDRLSWKPNEMAKHEVYSDLGTREWKSLGSSQKIADIGKILPENSPLWRAFAIGFQEESKLLETPRPGEEKSAIRIAEKAKEKREEQLYTMRIICDMKNSSAATVKCKARLVPRPFGLDTTREEGYSCEMAYEPSPTPALLAVRLMLSISVQMGWELATGDVSRAFQYNTGIRERPAFTVQCELPPIPKQWKQEFKTGEMEKWMNPENMVTIQCALYGLPRGSSDFVQRAAEAIKRNGKGRVTRRIAQPCLYAYFEDAEKAKEWESGTDHSPEGIMLEHSDDFLCAGPDEAIKYFRKTLEAEFEMDWQMLTTEKPMEFVGMEIVREEVGQAISVNMDKKIFGLTPMTIKSQEEFGTVFSEQQTAAHRSLRQAIRYITSNISSEAFLTHLIGSGSESVRQNGVDDRLLNMQVERLQDTLPAIRFTKWEKELWQDQLVLMCYSDFSEAFKASSFFHAIAPEGQIPQQGHKSIVSLLYADGGCTKSQTTKVGSYWGETCALAASLHTAMGTAELFKSMTGRKLRIQGLTDSRSIDARVQRFGLGVAAKKEGAVFSELESLLKGITAGKFGISFISEESNLSDALGKVVQCEKRAALLDAIKGQGASIETVKSGMLDTVRSRELYFHGVKLARLKTSKIFTDQEMEKMGSLFKEAETQNDEDFTKELDRLYEMRRQKESRCAQSTPEGKVQWKKAMRG